MLRRTLVTIGVLALAVGRRLRGQSRGELQRMTDEQLATTPHKSAKIMKMGSDELARLLKDPDASDFVKAKACQRLAVVGNEGAVPAIAALLSESTLAHYARTALEPMPGKAADDVLREALDTLEGDLLVGVINSVAWRRDPEALGALATLRRSDDAAVSNAATGAISRIRRP